MRHDRHLEAVPESAPVARDLVRRTAVELGLDERSVFDMMLATTEAVANAIEHGSAEPLLLSIRRGEGRMVVEVVNAGDPLPGPPSRDGQPERGRGLPLMAATVDTLELHPTRDATRVLLHKRLRAA